jgi:hypothetical protein
VNGTAFIPGTALAAPQNGPTQTGCPAGYSHLRVAYLESQGPYMAPRAIDEAGNNNGFVCGRPLPPAAAEQACGGVMPSPGGLSAPGRRLPGAAVN